MKTKSPTFKLLVSRLHLLLSCNVVTYSLVHLFQKCNKMFWMWYHRFEGLQLSTSWVWSNKKEGNTSSLCPIERCAGVSGSTSLGSSDITLIGREFSTASIWQKRVVNSSNFKTLLPIVLRKCFFALFTAASHKPPKWGALGVWSSIECQEH